MPPKKRKSHHGGSQPRKRKAAKRVEETSEVQEPDDVTTQLLDVEGVEQANETQEAEHEVAKHLDIGGTEQTSDIQGIEHKSTQELDAYNKVFRTTELLEACLEYLSPLDLYSIQRINRQFQAVIFSSQRIQQKMFFRIDNKRAACWNFQYKEFKYLRDEAEVFEMERIPYHSMPIPVMTSRERFDDPWERFDEPRAHAISLLGSAKEIMAIGEEVRRQHAKRLLGRLQQPSVSRDLLMSKLQRQVIEVKLCFALGVRRPTLITFTSKVRNTGPLDVGDIIEGALNTRCQLRVKWRLIDGHIRPNLQKVHEGIPKHFIKNLKSKTGLDAYLKPEDSSFRLCRFRRPGKLTLATKGPVVRTIEISSESDSDGVTYTD